MGKYLAFGEDRHSCTRSVRPDLESIFSRPARPVSQKSNIPHHKYPYIISREMRFQRLSFFRTVDKSFDWLIANLGTITDETCEEDCVETF